MARRGNRTGMRAVTGLACLLFGVFACVVPFASPAVAMVALSAGLVIAAVAQLLAGVGSTLSRRSLAAVHLVGAAAIGLWPHLPLAGAAAVAGVVLVASGAVEFWTGLATGGSWVAMGSGAFTLVTGAVATLWVDPVLLPIVVALGWRLVLAGAGLLVDLWYPPGLLGIRTGPRRVFGRVGALAVAVVLTVAAVAADPRTTVPEFYDIGAPVDSQVGDLLRAEEIAAPTGSTAFRLLYSTLGDQGFALAASAVLYVPSATKGSALPLVVWAHGTTGIARNCAPSLLGEQAGGLTATAALLDDGYAVLALDLTGLGSAGPSSYLLGTGEARAVLDGIRAVRRVPGIFVGSSVLWGYEQGGHAVLWAAELAPTYAPDVVLSGVVAVAPATDLTALFTAAIAAGSAGTLGTDLLETYSARYSDVTLRDYTGAGPALLDEVAAHCRGARGLVGEAWAQVSGFDQAWTMPDTSALASRLAENTPAGPFAEAVLVVQGASDTTVPAVVQDDWVQARCSSGVRLEYRKLAGADHADVVRNGSVAVTGILAWITDRFAGTSVPGTCE